MGYQFLDRSRFDVLDKCLENYSKSACDFILLD